jgi:hypothetical protein
LISVSLILHLILGWIYTCHMSLRAHFATLAPHASAGEQPPCTLGDCFVAKNKGAPRNDMMKRHKGI